MNQLIVCSGVLFVLLLTTANSSPFVNPDSEAAGPDSDPGSPMSEESDPGSPASEVANQEVIEFLANRGCSGQVLLGNAHPQFTNVHGDLRLATPYSATYTRLLDEKIMADTRLLLNLKQFLIHSFYELLIKEKQGDEFLAGKTAKIMEFIRQFSQNGAVIESYCHTATHNHPNSLVDFFKNSVDLTSDMELSNKDDAYDYVKKTLHEVELSITAVDRGLAIDISRTAFNTVPLVEAHAPIIEYLRSQGRPEVANLLKFTAEILRRRNEGQDIQSIDADQIFEDIKRGNAED